MFLQWCQNITNLFIIFLILINIDIYPILLFFKSSRPLLKKVLAMVS